MIKIEKLLGLDIEEHTKIPFRLECHFMKAARMLVDIDKGRVNVRIKDHEVYFHVIDIT